MHKIVTNLYIPPTTSCPNNFIPDISPYLTNRDSLVIGDINAHDDLWHSSITDQRGNDLAEQISASNFGVLNEEMPTRVPTNGTKTSPDISLASPSLLTSCEWSTEVALSSDHVPIIISVASKSHIQTSSNRTFINFKKADWELFTKVTEEKFEELACPTDAKTAKHLIINKASGCAIPSGR